MRACVRVCTILKDFLFLLAPHFCFHMNSVVISHVFRWQVAQEEKSKSNNESKKRKRECKENRSLKIVGSVAEDGRIT